VSAKRRRSATSSIPPCLEKATIPDEFLTGQAFAAAFGGNDMKQFCAGLALAAVMACGATLTAPAHAVPPTAVPSPGYDARLQEQRAAHSYYEPVVRAPAAMHRRHVRRHHDGAH
jgi:hypothetical protein